MLRGKRSLWQFLRRGEVFPEKAFMEERAQFILAFILV